MINKEKGGTIAIIGAVLLVFLLYGVQAIIDDKNLFAADIYDAFTKWQLNANAEWFELQVNNDVDPMSVVITAGYDQQGWKYLGPRLSGKQTLRVKLVRLGFTRNLDEAKKKADEMGYRLVEDQASKSFKVRFPKPDGMGPVVFGGSQWQDQNGIARVTSLYNFKGEWDIYFRWSGNNFLIGSRWLVADKYLKT